MFLRGERGGAEQMTEENAAVVRLPSQTSYCVAEVSTHDDMDGRGPVRSAAKSALWVRDSSESLDDRESG